jgi:hypothetical protein
MKDVHVQIYRGLRWSIIGLLFAATLVRILPIAYDAPWGGLFSSDEIDSVSRALKLASGDLLPIHGNKPTHYAELLALAYGAQFVAEHLVLGTTRDAFESRFFLSPFLFYASARFLSAAFSIATLALLLWSLRRHGLGAQLLGVIVIALAASSVEYAHIAKEDALAQFWTFAAFVAALGMLTANRREADVALRRWAMASGLAAGLAISTKYNCFWVPLYSVLAWALIWRETPAGRRRMVWTSGALCLATMIIGFVAGTPAVIFDQHRFWLATLRSDISRELRSTFGSLPYLDKYGPHFFAEIFWQEFGIGWVAVVLAALLFLVRASGLRLFVLLPAAIYLATLLAVGHLDYQYTILLTPIAAWMVAHEMSARMHDRRPSLLWIKLDRLRPKTRYTLIGLKRVVLGAIAVFLLAGLVQNTWRVARRTAECLGGDTRVLAGRWLEKQARANPHAFDKPLLILSPFYYRYHPMVAFTPATYERLLERTREQGGAGSYFERAALFARRDTRLQFDADFLEVQWHFNRRADGTLEFRKQPFSLNLADYVGRYSLVIAPEATFMYLGPHNQTMPRDVVTFLEQVAELPLRAQFVAQPWRSTGPSVWIYTAPASMDDLTTRPVRRRR